MKILKKIKRKKGTNEGYIVLNDKNTVKKEIYCEKPSISVLMDRLNEITKEPIGYEKLTEEVHLTEEEVCVLLCGEVKIDTENKTVRAEAVNKEDALLELAGIC